MRTTGAALLAALALSVTLVLPATAEAPAAEAGEPPLHAGVLADAPPFVFKAADGKLMGFTIDLFRLIAARMGRSIDFTTAPQPALYGGLADGTYTVLPGPIAATPDRAEAMLLLEGYASSEFQFAARHGTPMAALSDLRGRRLAVRQDSQYGDWAEANAGRYGFTVLPVPTSIVAARAVLDGRADASLSGSLVQQYVAKGDANFAPGLSLPETLVHESAAVGKSETELRDDMEAALQCLKIDGTVARLSRQWFGRDPDAEDLERLVIPGFGVPGLAGYDAKPRKTHC